MKPPHRARAFTIIELLAAVTVLSIILLLMAQMTGMVNKAYGEGLGRVDNFTKSRAMMDLLVSDLRHAVLRTDLPAFQVGGAYSAATGYPAATSTTATNAFYTQLPSINPNSGTTTPRKLSLVSYSISSDNVPALDKVALWRADNAGIWDNNALQQFQDSMAVPLGQTVPREMAPGVVGFQLLFRRQDGTVTLLYPGHDAANPIISIGVAIAVIGNKSLDHLKTSSPDQIGAIRTALVIPSSATPNSAKSYWDNTVLVSSFFRGYPTDLGSNLRTFERWIDCPAF